MRIFFRLLNFGLRETSQFSPSNNKLFTKGHRTIIHINYAKEISCPVDDLCRRFIRLTGPSVYTLQSTCYELPAQHMVQMAFCDLSHTFHKKVTNVSQHVFVIPLWGILSSSLTFRKKIERD